MLLHDSVDPAGWQKQQPDKPLFPNLLWSRPENKIHAGKLLIIGGNAQAFSAPAEAYAMAEKAGAGSIRALLPDAARTPLRSMVGTLELEFAPSTPSGSFARGALAEWLSAAQWADAVLLAGNIGRNSETAIVLEQFVTKYAGPLVITEDCLDQLTHATERVYNREHTLIVCAFGQLQRAWPQLMRHLSEPATLSYSQGTPVLVETLHDLTAHIPAAIITKHQETLVGVVGGRAVSMRSDQDIWRISIAASASVWWMQNPSKPLEAIATAWFEVFGQAT